MRNHTLIIAEAGVNHNGSMELAKKLIDAAAAAGVDIVKFQTFKAKNVASKRAEKASYQQAATGNESQLVMLEKLELTEADHTELIGYCNQKITFLSTPFDLESIQLLKNFGITIGKIPSGEITNLPYLQAMAKTFPELIISTGMCTMNEIKEALDVVYSSGAKKENITILHCNTEYPTPMDDVNLLAMRTIKNELGLQVGYSDHTKGIEVPVAAVALGATVIEKHFTLDRNMEGPDHKASLEPEELKQMVNAIRNIELALGDGIKAPSRSETKNIAIARKSLVAAQSMAAGKIIAAEDLKIKRPGTGISPMQIHEIIGKKLILPVEEDQVLTDAHFE
jgi:N,N'-diacetyllegionaminate synthase